MGIGSCLRVTTYLGGKGMSLADEKNRADDQGSSKEGIKKPPRPCGRWGIFIK
jgi:hypothetical protein